MPAARRTTPGLMSVRDSNAENALKPLPLFVYVCGGAIQRARHQSACRAWQLVGLLGCANYASTTNQVWGGGGRAKEQENLGLVPRHE
jgi:hypothetical protein